MTVDQLMPRNSKGINTMYPAIVPAMPISNKAFRLGNGSRMRMTAPSVPKMVNGMGMKYGSVASIW